MLKKYQCRERLRETLKWLYNWWCSGANKTEQSGAFSPSEDARVRERERETRRVAMSAPAPRLCVFSRAHSKSVIFWRAARSASSDKINSMARQEAVRESPKKADRVAGRSKISGGGSKPFAWRRDD